MLYLQVVEASQQQQEQQEQHRRTPGELEAKARFSFNSSGSSEGEACSTSRPSQTDLLPYERRGRTAPLCARLLIDTSRLRQICTYVSEQWVDEQRVTCDVAGHIQSVITHSLTDSLTH